MKRSAVVMAAAMLGLIAGPALAADLPARAAAAPASYVYGWEGIYIQGFGFYGVNAGNPTMSVAAAGTTAISGLGAGANGPGFGGAIGYDYQIGKNGLTIGARVEESWANIRQSGSIGAGSLNFQDSTNHLGALNAIVGIPITADGRARLYGGGGFAWMGVAPNFSIPSTTPADFIQAAASGTSTGFDFLGGLQYQLDPHWSLFGETAWYSINNKSLSARLPGTPPVEVVTSNSPYSVVISKIGVSYKFQ